MEVVILSRILKKGTKYPFKDFWKPIKDQNKDYPNMLAVGLYDGTIAVYNIMK